MKIKMRRESELVKLFEKEFEVADKANEVCLKSTGVTYGKSVAFLIDNLQQSSGLLKRDEPTKYNFDFRRV